MTDFFYFPTSRPILCVSSLETYIPDPVSCPTYINETRGGAPGRLSFVQKELK